MFTPEQQAKLEGKLDKSNVKPRKGANGRTVSYVEGWYVVDMANEVFGFGNWDAETVEMKREHEPVQIPPTEEHPKGGIVVTYSARVRITVYSPGRLPQGRAGAFGRPPRLRPHRGSGRGGLHQGGRDGRDQARVRHLRQHLRARAVRQGAAQRRRARAAPDRSRARSGPWRRSMKASTSRSPSDRRPASAPWRPRHGHRQHEPMGGTTRRCRTEVRPWNCSSCSLASSSCCSWPRRAGSTATAAYSTNSAAATPTLQNRRGIDRAESENAAARGIVERWPVSVTSVKRRRTA